METKTAERKQYAANRAAVCALLGVSIAAFNARAGRLASELADGEEVLPSHWTAAASEIRGLVEINDRLEIAGLRREAVAS